MWGCSSSGKLHRNSKLEFFWQPARLEFAVNPVMLQDGAFLVSDQTGKWLFLVPPAGHAGVNRDVLKPLGEEEQFLVLH